MIEQPFGVKGSQSKQIIGIQHIPDTKNNEVIIMCHGFTGNKLGSHSEFFKKMAREFCKERFTVIRFDFTGSGDSEGEFEEQNLLTEFEDLQKVINYVQEKFNPERIILIGHSRGGFISIWSACEDSRIKAVISIAGAAKMELIWGKAERDEIMDKGSMFDSFLGFTYTKKLLELDLKFGDITKYIGKLKVPLLLIYQKFDKWVSIEHADIIYNNANCEKKKIIIDGEDHIFIDKKQINYITNEILSWLS